MHSEEELIISLVKGIIPGKQWIFPEKVIQQGFNWKRFKDLVSYHEVYPYLYPLIKNSANLFPVEIVDFLKNNYFYQIMQAQRLMREFLGISVAFDQAQIRMVPIKGIALLKDIYDHLPARPMVDIDLLVEKTNLFPARDILLNLGFLESSGGLSQGYWLEKQCHLSFAKKNTEKDIILLDLHFSLDFKRKNPEILPQLWSRVNAGMLSVEDTIFSLALHQRRFGKALGLKNVVDTGLILKKYQNTLDWNYLIAQAKTGRMRCSLFFLLTQVKIIFDAEICLPELKLFCPNYFKRKLIKSFIKRNVFSDRLNKKAKLLYLKSHFLLYDNFFEPVSYILNIPLEQFAKFYNLDAYDKKTKFLYKHRLVYILYRSVLGFLKKSE